MESSALSSLDQEGPSPPSTRNGYAITRNKRAVGLILYGTLNRYVGTAGILQRLSNDPYISVQNGLFEVTKKAVSSRPQAPFLSQPCVDGLEVVRHQTPRLSPSSRPSKRQCPPEPASAMGSLVSTRSSTCLAQALLL